MSRDYITCHILDTVKGIPASGVPATLSRLDGQDFTVLASGATDDDGRISNWSSRPVTAVHPGAYKIKFETGPYLAKISNNEPFFPYVEIVFNVTNPPQAHYHIPLLLSPYAYHTYRGS